MFDRMQYIIDKRKSLGLTKGWEWKIRDFEGSPIGRVVYGLIAKGACRFEDNAGLMTGELRKGVIYGPLKDVHGHVESSENYLVNRMQHTVTIPSSTLFDAEGNEVAKMDPFTCYDGLSTFNNIRSGRGLDIRTLNGAIVATAVGAKNSDGVQIDLFSSSVNQLALFSLMCWRICQGGLP
jgi:hypothetical protein